MRETESDNSFRRGDSMNRVMLGLATAAFGVMASTAAAQNTMGGGVGGGFVGFGVLGGANFPISDLGNGVNTGFNVGGLLDFSVPVFPVGLRADVTYNQFSLKGPVPGKFKAIGGDLNALIKVPMDVGFSPYLTGGVGFYNLRTSFETATPGQTLNTASQNKFALNGGAGIQFNLGGLATFVEGRYMYIFTDNGRTTYFPVSVGVMFHP